MTATLSMAGPATTPASIRQEEPLIKAGTQEVVLDLVVRDKHGRLITDLKPEDLQIFDKGGQRKIQSLRLVDGRHQDGAAQVTAVDAEKAARVDSTKQIRLVTLIFNRLDLSGRALAHTAAIDLLKSELPENVFMSVLVLDDSLQALQPFTNNRALLRKAVDRATSGAYAEFTSDSKRIEDEMKQLLGPATGGESLGQQVQGHADMNGGTGRGHSGESATPAMAQLMLNMLQTTRRSEMAQVGRSSIWGLFSAVDGLTRLPGRKSILFFSSGFGVPQGMEGAWKALIGTANRFNITFYSIDARGLGTTMQNEQAVAELRDATAASAANSAVSGAVTPAMANASDTAINAGKNNGQDTLSDLAQSTGGFSIANTNDFREGLQKVSEDIGSYYEVSYDPQISSYDGTYRKIDVRPVRAGLRIQSRSGYFALPLSAGALAPYDISLLETLNGRPLSHSFDFESAVLHFRGSGSECVCSVVLDVPLDKVTLRQIQAHGPYQGDLAYMAVLKNAAGEVIQKFSGEVPLAETSAQLPDAQKSHFIFTQNLRLSPGRYTLEAAVMDMTDNRTSARKSVFLVPEQQPGLSVSSVALVRNVRDSAASNASEDPFYMVGKMITPSLSPAMTEDQQGLRFYLAVYPDRSVEGKTELSMTFSRDGMRVGNGSIVLPVPDAAGRIQYIAAASAVSFEPGNYQVDFLVTQGSKQAHEVMTFSLK